MTKTNVPDGYKKDSMGRLVPVDMIDEIDLMRDDLVNEKIQKMQALHAQLATLKAELINDMRAFVDVSAGRYGVTIGGKGGNVTLNNFDGSAKLQLHVAKNLLFDERLQAAKVLVDNCIKRWSKGANKHLHVLVDEAFQVDKEGKINTQRVLSLTRINIDDADWQAAMQAIKDSLSVLSTTTYVRGYVRDSARPDDKMQPIVLDLAGV
ncbi:MAG: sulfate transporter [Gammaproteobacteria bacterium]|nr:MAG: sulfate transporter [Gammaproteobacteria bacterium]